MNADPYNVLGVSPGASPQEIKKKYRALVKKYHPDLHPDDKNAAAKMSEINEAYELIKNGLPHGTGHSPDLGDGEEDYFFFTKGATDFFRRKYPEDFFAEDFFMDSSPSGKNSFDWYELVRDFISLREYYRAVTVLNGIAFSERDARWNYYAAVICYENFRYAEAMDYADRAASADPSNKEYRALSEKIHRKFKERRGIREKSRSFIAVCAVIFALLFIIQVISPLIYALKR